ncbi:hypothetical protein J2Y40_000312 [Chryseobacterium sp. 2987]|nr:hypothetical protein [Chryseobacterium sp. 2987]
MMFYIIIYDLTFVGVKRIFEVNFEIFEMENNKLFNNYYSINYLCVIKDCL